jgi:hypothetical protein
LNVKQFLIAKRIQCVGFASSQFSSLGRLGPGGPTNKGGEKGIPKSVGESVASEGPIAGLFDKFRVEPTDGLTETSIVGEEEDAFSPGAGVSARGGQLGFDPSWKGLSCGNVEGCTDDIGVLLGKLDGVPIGE